MELCQILVRETNTLEAYQDLANCCESLGRVYCLLRDFVQAQPYFETLRSLRESLARQLGTVQIHRELASCYESVSYTHLKPVNNVENSIFLPVLPGESRQKQSFMLTQKAQNHL